MGVRIPPSAPYYAILKDRGYRNKRYKDNSVAEPFAKKIIIIQYMEFKLILNFYRLF